LQETDPENFGKQPDGKFTGKAGMAMPQGFCPHPLEMKVFCIIFYFILHFG